MARVRTILISGATLISMGCGGNPTAPAPAARIQLTASPAAITPTICPPSSCGPVADQLEALTTLTIRETGGVGGIVESATLTLRRDSDGAVLANAAGTPTPVRFTANQSVTVPTSVHYDRAQGRHPATLTIALTGEDDNGHAIQATLAIPVAAFSGS